MVDRHRYSEKEIKDGSDEQAGIVFWCMEGRGISIYPPGLLPLVKGGGIFTS